MLETISPFRFPADDSLCERCGYPLRGLADDSSCPECGLAVAESSPVKRDGPAFQEGFVLVTFLCNAAFFLFYPRREFRSLSMSPSNFAARVNLAMCALAVALVFWSMISGELFGYPRSPLWIGIAALAVVALTYLEMLGVTAFSKRRGWRVPFALAERVCCYASVGWLPGVLLAVAAVQLLKAYAIGQPWFDSLLGLVRVSWIFYGGLFVLSLLWFETLVWLGVRQVKYANAWPDAQDPAATGSADAQSPSQPADQ